MSKGARTYPLADPIAQSEAANLDVRSEGKKMGEIAKLSGGSLVAAYLDAHGVGMSGTFFKFAKDGKFKQTSNDEEIPEGTQFVVIYDQTQGGWIKFNGKGEPPERKQGPLFD